MCGIIGLINLQGITKEDITYFSKVLAKSVSRGHQATGVGTQDLRIWKNPQPSTQFVGSKKFREFSKAALGQKWIIGHTRHSTQGNPENNINNHPLTSMPNNYIMVHNGVVYSQDVSSDKNKTDSYIISDAIKQSWRNAPLRDIVKGAYSLFYGYAATIVVSKSSIVLSAKSNPIDGGELPNGSLIFASQLEFFPEKTSNIFSFVSGESISYDINGNKSRQIVEMAKSPERVYNWNNIKPATQKYFLEDYEEDEIEEDKLWIKQRINWYNPKKEKKKQVKVKNYERGK